MRTREMAIFIYFIIKNEPDNKNRQSTSSQSVGIAFTI